MIHAKGATVSYQFRSDAIRNTSIGAGLTDVRTFTLTMRFHSGFVVARKAGICLGQGFKNRGGLTYPKFRYRKRFAVCDSSSLGGSLDGLRRDVCREPLLLISVRVEQVRVASCLHQEQTELSPVLPLRANDAGKMRHPALF